MLAPSITRPTEGRATLFMMASDTVDIPSHVNVNFPSRRQMSPVAEVPMTSNKGSQKPYRDRIVSCTLTIQRPQTGKVSNHRDLHLIGNGSSSLTTTVRSGRVVGCNRCVTRTLTGEMGRSVANGMRRTKSIQSLRSAGIVPPHWAMKERKSSEMGCVASIIHPDLTMTQAQKKTNVPATGFGAFVVEGIVFCQDVHGRGAFGRFFHSKHTVKRKRPTAGCTPLFMQKVGGGRWE